MEFVFGLIASATGSLLGAGFLLLLRVMQKRDQRDCPYCGRPGGTRATPSGRGEGLALAFIVAVTLAALCGLPITIYQLVVNHAWWWIAGGALGAAAAYGMLRYINWYRSFPLVKCGCGWRREEAPPT